MSIGIYLPNMEMPKEGSWTTVRIYPDGTCAVPNWQGDCTLIKDTKAVPVPPYGRLIDADAFLELCVDYAVTPSDYEFCKRLEYALTKARTIIPADADEERREYEAAVEAAQYCEMYEPTYDPETGAM